MRGFIVTRRSFVISTAVSSRVREHPAQNPVFTKLRLVKIMVPKIEFVLTTYQITTLAVVIFIIMSLVSQNVICAMRISNAQISPKRDSHIGQKRKTYGIQGKRKSRFPKHQIMCKKQTNHFSEIKHVT